jgi:AraC-like DNA-binding protein
MKTACEKSINPRFIIEPRLGFEMLACSGRRMAYPLHSHVSTYVLGLVRRGSMRLAKNGMAEEKVLRPGDTFVLRPYEAHRLSASGHYALLNLCIDKHVFFAPDAGEKLDAIAALLTALCHEGWLSADERTRLVTTLDDLRKHPGKAMDESGNCIDNLKTFLEEYPEKADKLDDLAEQARLGKFSLIRKFRQRYGLTPHRFQIQNRIRRVRRECLHTLSLVQLALAAGFYDQSHMIREFRKATGMTPGQYRQARRHAAVFRPTA